MVVTYLLTRCFILRQPLIPARRTLARVNDRRYFCNGAQNIQRTERSSESSSPTINITDSCAQKLNKIAASGVCLRILVDSGGCSGFEYKFELVEKDKIDPKDDVIFEKSGAKVVVDNLSLDFLNGATIDYQEELIKSAFKIVNNPKAAKGCSCGASFSLK
uniref:Iron-sulfur cluster assembly 2 homolog, mitochondrial n=1 Tax=Romanomermis culicivorax TaxID=13658 RepID=A0A915JDI4_ROMCU